MKTLIDEENIQNEKWAVSFFRENKPVQINYKKFSRDLKLAIGYLNSKKIVGKKAGLVGSNSYEWIIAFVSLVYLGNKVIPFDVMDARKEFLELHEEMDVLFLEEGTIGEDVLFSKLNSSFYFLNVLFEEMEYFSNKLKNINLKHSNERKASIIVFTSGTTGKRKGVELSINNILHSATGLGSALGFSNELNILVISPLHHILGISLITCMLLNHGNLILAKNKFNPKLENQAFNPTFIPSVPLLLERYWSLYKKDSRFFGSKLEVINCGSAPTNQKLIKNYLDAGLTVCLSYGMSETAPFLTSVCKTDLREKRTTVGRALENVQIKIIEGEICAKGENVFSGYTNYSNADIFTDDGWFKTGDMGSIDKDGYLSITGRKKNMIPLINGKNIYPEEIEETVKSMNENIKEIIITTNDNLSLIAEVYSPDISPEVIKYTITKYNDEQISYKNIMNIKFRQEPFPRNTLNKIVRDR
ncbi:AMP-binding protein [Enterococcus hulanensis]|uniref:AMP-binding protein n=1 Tax=Enterococcus hulanensis TaxID=2559929 RepID=UPI0028921109|nr:AMP-binding protein [Enterococcus hulanensis]MDT2660511.1 AMP-binding protein [Enterococcus hulanensis]